MMKNEPFMSFRQKIERHRFCYGAELAIGRRDLPSELSNPIIELGEILCSDPRIDWISLTDTPGSQTILPPHRFARFLAHHRTKAVIHLSCKDMNRNDLESTARECAADGFENLVAMTGDYPSDNRAAVPVFDLDSVSLISLLNAMNERSPKTHFMIGCVVSPFKRLERALMPQYFKLLKKISCGAGFVITQLGFDMRKFFEVRLWLSAHHMNVPVIGNVFLLNKTTTERFYKNQVPGCVVNDSLYELACKYSAGPDKGRGFFIELAARQLAAFKGLEFAGGYLSGMTKAETFFEVIEKSKSFGENDWKEFAKTIQFAEKNEFYLFDADPKSGLGDPNSLNLNNLRSTRPKATVGYRFSRYLHKKVFTPGSSGFNLMKRLYSHWDKKPGALARMAHRVERLLKFVCFGCKHCGDCSLPQCAHLCPLSCPKKLRNGPCGGSHDGWCELNDRECVWGRIYERLKSFHESEGMLDHPVAFYQSRLKGTSSWANTFLGRDHSGESKQ
jgi:methylenetetrahydrofolate reductase (NADPH)